MWVHANFVRRISNLSLDRYKMSESPMTNLKLVTPYPNVRATMTHTTLDELIPRKHINALRSSLRTIIPIVAPPSEKRSSRDALTQGCLRSHFWRLPIVASKVRKTFFAAK